MTPYYDYDVSYIIDMIEWADLPYKVIGMTDLGDKNRTCAWIVRFDNVNYIEVYADHYVIQQGNETGDKLLNDHRDQQHENGAVKGPGTQKTFQHGWKPRKN